jgi:3-dehydroquinate synthase
LLAQIDASVGGKVGIDFNNFKNIIGVFNEPKLVVVYPYFLKTLNKRQMLSGYAEALKHGLIADKSYWKKLQTGLLSDANNWEVLIETSIEIKNTIVKNDFNEKGERKKLNFGHTIGHAIESHSLKHDKLPLLHGEAIAIGMICEAYISHLVLNLTSKELKEISSTILSYFNYYKIKESFFNHYLELMKNDKKNENNTISTENIIESLRYYISIAN